jgi:hypothetical protein
MHADVLIFMSPWREGQTVSSNSLEGSILLDRESRRGTKPLSELQIRISRRIRSHNQNGCMLCTKRPGWVLNEKIIFLKYRDTVPEIKGEVGKCYEILCWLPMLSSSVNSFTCRQKGLQAFRHAILAQLTRTVGHCRYIYIFWRTCKFSSVLYVPPVGKSCPYLKESLSRDFWGPFLACMDRSRPV